MGTKLLIAGHGENRDATFDSGATGYIKKGEHRYMEEDLFPAMKKFIPKGADVVFFSDYNVYDYGNLASLAKSYGSGTGVIEMHYDAFTENARGGHVIVHADYKPDALDLRIRDVIKKHIGVRYSHQGYEGISGRNNLKNANIARKNGINYRLVELGFGTNLKDAEIMTKNVDAIAKDLVEALFGKVADKPVEVKPTKVEKPKAVVEPAKKTIDQLAREVMQGEHGDGDQRKKSLGSKYDAVQARVNELSGIKPRNEGVKKGDKVTTPTLYATSTSTKNVRKTPISGTVDAINQNWRNQVRLKDSRGNYIGFTRLSDIGATAPKNKKKSPDQVANEIIKGVGGWGNDPQRSAKLRKEGYDPKVVQSIINSKL